jgi:hypothetical protein
VILAAWEVASTSLGGSVTASPLRFLPAPSSSPDETATSSR